MSKNKTLKNIYINLIVTVGISLFTFILNRYFARYMGAETLGLMRLFTQMVTYLTLGELGLGVASAYALYKPLAERDEKRISVVLSTIEDLYNKIALGVTAVGLIANILLQFFINTESYGDKIYVYWSLYVINTGISYMFAKYTILFTADHNYGFVRKIQGIGRVGLQILQIVSIVYFQSFLIYIILMLMENLFILFSYRRFFKKGYQYYSKTKERDNHIKSDIKNLFWHQIASVVVNNTDYMIVSKFLNLAVVGIYSSYFMVYQMVMMTVDIVTQVLTPNIGHFVAQNTKGEIYNHWKRLNALYFFVGTALVFITYKIINPFMYLWLGEAYILPKLTVIYIMVNLFLKITGNMTRVFKNSSGYFKDIYSPMLEVLINLVLSIYLVKRIGLDGVILGTIISYFVVAFILRHILVYRNCFEKNPIYFLGFIGKYSVLVGGGIYITNFILEKIKFISIGKNLLDTTLFFWIKQSVAITAITFIILGVIFLLDKSFRDFLKCNILPKFKKGLI